MKILIVTPEPRATPVGNSVTAARWAGILRSLRYEVDIRNTWTDEDCGLLIALHACRSAESVERFRRAHPQRPLIVALTGTDLYRDLQSSPKGHQSLALATHIVALQECAIEDLDQAARAKTTIIYQSAVPPERRPALSEDFFDVCVLSHLRLLKDPLQAAYAARLLPADSRVRVRHAGRVLEAGWESKAREEERVNPRYHWLGEQSHDESMQLLASSRLLVVSSTMEGGANAIAEAVTCGVPVFCSDIPGNVGMLGRSYAGYFPLHDSQHLANLLARAERDGEFIASLHSSIQNIQNRFSPQEETASWQRLLAAAFR